MARILIADSQDEAREGLAEVARSGGNVLTPARDYLELVEQLLVGDHDFLLVDPELDGATPRGLRRLVGGLPEGAPVVLLISQRSGRELDELVRWHRADGAIVKGADAPGLVRALVQTSRSQPPRPRTSPGRRPRSTHPGRLRSLRTTPPRPRHRSQRLAPMRRLSTRAC